MKLRSDLLDENSPERLEVIQLTTEDVPSSHIYMEAQIFTPDSKRLVVHRSAHAHGSDKNDPEHRYLVCDIENDCELFPITEEVGATAPSVSPDGQLLYYFVNETEPNSGTLTLKRVRLDGTERETLLVIDSNLPDTNYRPNRIYPLSTISSDGNRLALSCFLSDGSEGGGTFGLMVFDVVEVTVRVILEGPSWCNVHPQYCRSTESDASRDILIQENHGNIADASGSVEKLVGGVGADIHVIRDDGTGFRNMPWGRDGNERCQGHQCWRGRSTWAITSTGTRQPQERQLIEGAVTNHDGHTGIQTAGAIRNDLSRDFESPQFSHFATDIEGRGFITDAGPFDEGARLFVAEFGEPGQDALKNWQYLLSPRSSCGKQAHIHPFLSPDGKTGFFNSDESGILQAYMVRGFEK
ncbi:MAG: hypothetical protein QGG53_24600 [Planctomycetota bacterium]|nr:hypothetical protein [Planctomycetota bacterium]